MTGNRRGGYRTSKTREIIGIYGGKYKRAERAISNLVESQNAANVAEPVVRRYRQ
jgi:hypothetical protein